MKLFKVKANYLKKDDEDSKNVSETYLFNAISYEEAERKATEHIKKYICGECEFNIQKVDYNEIIRKFKDNEEKDAFWYEVRILYKEINDKGEEKYISEKYIVEALNFEDSIECVKNFMKSSLQDWFFSLVQETLIEEVIE